MIDNVKAPVHHYRPAKVECIVANADYFIGRTLLHEHHVHPIDNVVGIFVGEEILAGLEAHREIDHV